MQLIVSESQLFGQSLLLGIVGSWQTGVVTYSIYRPCITLVHRPISINLRQAASGTSPYVTERKMILEKELEGQSQERQCYVISGTLVLIAFVFAIVQEHSQTLRPLIPWCHPQTRKPQISY